MSNLAMRLHALLNLVSPRIGQNGPNAQNNAVWVGFKPGPGQSLDKIVLIRPDKFNPVLSNCALMKFTHWIILRLNYPMLFILEVIILGKLDYGRIMMKNLNFVLQTGNTYSFGG